MVEKWQEENRKKYEKKCHDDKIRAQQLAKEHKLSLKYITSVKEILFLFDDPYASNRILVFDEKDGKRMFDASTGEKVFQACKKILSDRYGDKSCWYNAKEALVELEANPPKSPTLSKDACNALEDPELRKLGIELWERFEKKTKQHKVALREYSNLCFALKEPTGEAAYAVVLESESREYENFDFCYLENLDDQG